MWPAAGSEKMSQRHNLHISGMARYFQFYRRCVPLTRGSIPSSLEISAGLAKAIDQVSIGMYGRLHKKVNIMMAFNVIHNFHGRM